LIVRSQKTTTHNMNNVPVDPIALQCVQNGTIECINVRIDLSGYRYSIVPGKSLVGTGPFHAFKKYDLDMSLPYLREHAEKKTEPEGSSRKRDSAGPDIVGKPRTQEEALALVKRFKLDSIERNGVSNILPRDSITVWEFKRPAPLFIARLMLVASAIGEPKAVSRITSDLEMRIQGCSTLKEWWSSSSSLQKWRLISTRKVSGEAKQGNPCPDDLRRLQQCECPFSETRIEVETFSVEDEEEAYGGVSFVEY